MFSFYISSQFKKDLKRLKKRSAGDFQTLNFFLKNLQHVGFKGLDMKYKPHYLKGNYKNCCECHVLNDLLLVWKENNTENQIILIRVGTHSDLF